MGRLLPEIFKRCCEWSEAVPRACNCFLSDRRETAEVNLCVLPFRHASSYTQFTRRIIVSIYLCFSKIRFQDRNISLPAEIGTLNYKNWRHPAVNVAVLCSDLWHCVASAVETLRTSWICSFFQPSTLFWRGRLQVPLQYPPPPPHENSDLINPEGKPIL